MLFNFFFRVYEKDFVVNAVLFVYLLYLEKKLTNIYLLSTVQRCGEN